MDEIVAETFATTWHRLHDVDGDPLPWLYGVARNVISARGRAAVSSADKVANLAAVEALSAPDHGESIGERDLILRALASLSDTDREALRLVAWEGLDQRQAARVCDITRVAFAMRVSRARRKLAAALADQQSAERALSMTTEGANL